MQGARVFSDKADHDKAIADYSEAIRLDPKWERAYYYRGCEYLAKKKYDQAIADYTEVLRIAPNHIEALLNRGIAYQRTRHHEEAVNDFSKCIRLEPNSADAYNNLAWVMAVCPDAKIRNGKKAVEYARKACEIDGWKTWNNLGTLAAACAEVRNFEEAVKWQKKCLEMQPPKEELANARRALAIYEQKKPNHEDQE